MRVVELALGGNHSVLLDERGQVWSFGSSGCGQTGHRKTKNLGVPTLVRYLRKRRIRQVACGWNHTLILVEPNHVYSTGFGKYGQLGLRDFEHRYEFTYVESLRGKNVTEIFAGGCHSWFLLDASRPEVEAIEPENLDFSDAPSPEQSFNDGNSPGPDDHPSPKPPSRSNKSFVDDEELYKKSKSNSLNRTGQLSGGLIRNRTGQPNALIQLHDKPTRLIDANNLQSIYSETANYKIQKRGSENQRTNRTMMSNDPKMKRKFTEELRPLPREGKFRSVEKPGLDGPHSLYKEGSAKASQKAPELEDDINHNFDNFMRTGDITHKFAPPGERDGRDDRRPYLPNDGEEYRDPSEAEEYREPSHE